MTTKGGMLIDADGDRPADQIAPGSNADGAVVSMTLDEAAVSIGRRDADEEAFAELLGDETAIEDLDDVSDLDDEET